MCLSPRPQRAEEMVGVYCFTSCHKITKKQTNTKAAGRTVENKSQNKIPFVYSLGLKRDGNGTAFLFPFSNGLEIYGGLFKKNISTECVAVSLRISLENVPSVGLCVSFNGATVAHRVELVVQVLLHPVWCSVLGQDTQP